MHVRKSQLLVFTTVVFAFLSTHSLSAGDAPVITAVIDARQLHRKLLFTTMEIPCQAGELRLWYPKWYPGAHGPMGRVEDIAGLQVSTSDGRPLPWERDEVELHCVKVQIPDGLSAVKVKMTTICNSPGISAAGIYTYGNTRVGVINWNTCVLYPEGPKSDEQPVSVRLILPETWKYATALKSRKQEKNEVTFDTVALTELIDNPLIAGEHLRTIKLDSGKTPQAFLHLASESKEAVEIPDKVIEKYSRLVQEAGAMFGVTHYPEFHFLVTCSDELGLYGLEHLRCSLNGVRKNDLVDDKSRVGWVAMLLPHEYVHSWCGKYRRPQSMITPDFHSPQKTKMLWVYEGLAQYLGDVLMVRCGLVSPETYRDTLRGYIQGQLHKAGRKWRSLEDTSIAGYLLRRPSPNWTDLRRDQDFYFEGMLLWMECDAIIRDLSQGKKTLDDFCRIFFASVHGKKTVAGYTYEDVIATLQQTQEYDWDGLFTRRVKTPMENLLLDYLQKLGYRVEYSNKPAKGVARPGSIAENSLGLRLAGNRIQSVIGDMPADKAGLSSGMRIMEVNGEKYSVDAMQKALEASTEKKTVSMKIQNGDNETDVSLPYADGVRFLHLKRMEDRPDVFMEIYKPLVK